MNLLKYFVVSVVFSLLILISSQALAATPVATTKVTTSSSVSTGVLVASVNLRDAKIVSQTGNVFNISFSISNGNGLQTGVKYGVKLVSDTKDQSILDEKVYDDSLALAENTTLQKWLKKFHRWPSIFLVETDSRKSTRSKNFGAMLRSAKFTKALQICSYKPSLK